jgi:hypothetical protein
MPPFVYSQQQLSSARQEIDAEVATRLDQERGKIAVAEALKAKRHLRLPAGQC